jgi:hypothetical protein
MFVVFYFIPSRSEKRVVSDRIVRRIRHLVIMRYFVGTE